MSREERRNPRSANGRPVVMSYRRLSGDAASDNPYPDLNSGARAIERMQRKGFGGPLGLTASGLNPAQCSPGGRDEIDRLAQVKADEIGRIHRSRDWEYGASIYYDVSGRLRSTKVRRLGAPGGGLMGKPKGWVADVHNHPEGPGRERAELAFDQHYADLLLEGVAKGYDYEPEGISRQREAYVQNYLQHEMAGPGRPSLPGRPGDGDADRIVKGGRSYIRNFDGTLRCFERSPARTGRHLLPWR